jgi:LAS superfamily LD-carboxypeptidase LdcB
LSNYSNGDFQTPYGVVTARNPGRFTAPPNLQTYKREEGDVVLQGPALRSFKEAEEAATPRRMRRKGKVLPILLTGVGYRSYALQKSLYAGDSSGRYANPDGSLHCEGLAVDIHMGQGVLRRQRIAYHLKKRGWHYSVSGEPWHSSFHLSG